MCVCVEGENVAGYFMTIKGFRRLENQYIGTCVSKTVAGVAGAAERVGCPAGIARGVAATAEINSKSVAPLWRMISSVCNSTEATSCQNNTDNLLASAQPQKRCGSRRRKGEEAEKARQPGPGAEQGFGRKAAALPT